MDRLTRALAAALSLYGLYWVFGVVEPFVYRYTFLLIALVLTFLSGIDEASAEGAAAVHAPRQRWVQVALATLTIVALVWPLIDLQSFTRRAATPTFVDVTLGILLIGLVLEATRRTVGWVLPATAIGFIAYAYFGPLLELIGAGLIAHRGYPLTRMVGTQYMTLEGLFGVPLDVASTYLVLFTLFGAVLERAGAARFYVDWAMSAMGRRSGAAGAGRAVVGAGFLLGTVSGSGVASTVTLGSCAGPLLRKSGYSRETAGAILASSGTGAILAPPALGAAAFLIAEFLGITYREVVVMALIPAILYYVAVLLMIEADARRVGKTGVVEELPSAARLAARYWYHFLPPIAIAVLLGIGTTPFRAVVLSTALAAALSMIRPESRLTPRRAFDALASGGKGIVPIVATTATAGIIVGVVTLTGLGLKLSSILVTLAGGNPVFTVFMAAVAVWMLGLAVPVTASYIIAAVMIVPALTQVGVPAFAAHMFVFYYSVLSEVTPPTALAPFAAAAVMGGNAYRTIMLTWKYTLPAFLVPFVFTLSADGLGLLMRASPGAILQATVTGLVGVAGLSAGLGGWIAAPTTVVERIGMIAGGVLLVFAGVTINLLGAALLALTIGVHLVRVRRAAAVETPAAGPAA
jgi:TRAP transporter 4TM/12TM fusion protein